MATQTEPEWEWICAKEEITGCNTQRMQVPGGWVYRTVMYDSVAMCFVPQHAGERA